MTTNLFTFQDCIDSRFLGILDELNDLAAIYLIVYILFDDYSIIVLSLSINGWIMEKDSF